MKNGVMDIIRQMANGVDLQKILDDFELSPVQAMAIFRARKGQRHLRARRQLARIHSKLVADRFGPFAIQRLTQLLSDEKPELRLKSALSMLAVSGLGSRHRRGKGAAGHAEEKDGAETIPMTSQEACDYLEAIGEILDRKERAAKAGSPEKVCYTKAAQ